MSNINEQLSPKANFLFGLAIGVAAISLIGFVVVLSMFMSGKAERKVSDNFGSTGNAAEQPNNPAPPNEGDNNIILAAVTDQDHIKGNRNAKISIVEFSDLECPFCQRFHATLQQIVDDYNGQVNWVYRHFPLASLHSKAAKEAEATECAAELGGNDAFWKYTDRLFAITPANNGLDLNQLPEIAEYVGLNRQQFTDCLDSGKYAAKVQDQVTQAQAAGGRGTPHSVIVAGDQKIPVSGAVPVNQLKSMIDPLLQ